MKLKDLIMLVSFDETEAAIETVFSSYGLEVNAWRKENWRKVFATLQSMEPEQGCDMCLRVLSGDVSGYYDEETLKKNPDYKRGFYSLTMTPWKNWLGMIVDEETLKSMSVPFILGNCIYEMTWWGYEEEIIHKNLVEKFDHNEEYEAYWERRRKEDAEAFKRRVELAEQGDMFSLFYLGVHYHNGWDVEKDPSQAVYWYRKAAEQGFAAAESMLGRCYLNGDGIDRDPSLGIYWYQKAAERGNSGAQYSLAGLYENGIGVERDFDMALYWYRKSADLGHEQAALAIKRLYEGSKED